MARDYSHTLFGTVARGEADWQSTWTLGGNPEERVSVADDGREIVAYLRATDLEGRRQLTEWGCNGRGVAALADLIDAELTAAGSARVLAPAIPDEPLYEYLKARAIGVASVRSAAWMLRSLNTGSLRARRSEAGASGEAETDASNPPGDGLEEWFPRDRFAFWPADRF